MRRILLLVVLAAATLVPAAQTDGALPADDRRVVVIGFDGASANTVERLMAADRMPHLSALAKRGGYAPLRTANPAQSPVSWAAMTTGLNPGETGIYDFLKRDFVTGENPIKIKIGVAEPYQVEPLSDWMRSGVVLGAGGVGAVLGLLAALALARFVNPRWKKGGAIQAAMTLPAMLAALAAVTALRFVPDEVTYPRNLRSGEPFWVTLDKAGHRCVALDAPLSFPADHMDHGACLSGLGTPDLRGTWGTFDIWTSDENVPRSTETGGVAYFVRRNVQEFDLVIAGPRDPLGDVVALRETTRKADEERYRRELAYEWAKPRRRMSETEEDMMRLQSRVRATLTVRLSDGDAQVTLQDGSVVSLVDQAWSDLLPVTFDIGPFVELHGRVRMLFTRDPKRRSFSLFCAPVQIDPSEELPPNFAIASPPGYAKSLADAVGPFETVGWPELTNPVKDDVLSDEEFLAHGKKILESREARLAEELSRDDWSCLFAMFGEPDRVQHALYRHTDPESPTYDPVNSPRLAGEIDRLYEEMDAIVGRAVAALADRPEVQLLVVSDHGFAPFRRGVNLTNFLRRDGFQVPRTGAEGRAMSVGDLASNSTFFPDVDWSKSVAYSMGLGNIFLNLKGREPKGIVPPERAQEVMDEIRKRLLLLTDSDGKKVVKEVYYGRDLYKGPRANEAPDLVVGFEWGYRVSWQSCLGALDKDVITDNTQRWSGDHCSVDPSLVPGVLFSSAPLRDDVDPGILDVLPSVLSVFGITRDDAEGESFLK